MFWQYDEFLINQIGRNEWPHYEKDEMGRDEGIWYPGIPGKKVAMKMKEQTMNPKNLSSASKRWY